MGGNCLIRPTMFQECISCTIYLACYYEVATFRLVVVQIFMIKNVNYSS